MPSTNEQDSLTQAQRYYRIRQRAVEDLQQLHDRISASLKSLPEKERKRQLDLMERDFRLAMTEAQNAKRDLDRLERREGQMRQAKEAYEFARFNASPEETDDIRRILALETQLESAGPHQPVTIPIDLAQTVVTLLKKRQTTRAAFPSDAYSLSPEQRLQVMKLDTAVEALKSVSRLVTQSLKDGKAHLEGEKPQEPPEDELAHLKKKLRPDLSSR